MDIGVLFLISSLHLSIVLRSLYRVCSLSVRVFLKYSNESGDFTLICVSQRDDVTVTRLGFSKLEKMLINGIWFLLGVTRFKNGLSSIKYRYE